jgi:hypothetical protein
MAKPMPLVEPEMRAVLPLSWRSMGRLYWRARIVA